MKGLQGDPGSVALSCPSNACLCPVVEGVESVAALECDDAMGFFKTISASMSVALRSWDPTLATLAKKPTYHFLGSVATFPVSKTGQLK